MNTTTLNMTTLDGGNVIIKRGEGGGSTPPSGGEGTSPAPIAENDVTFYDYDGTVLYAYTKEEFLALTAMPPLPTREGLICQEWNWTWEEAYDYVSKYGICMIGATYTTDDGKTRMIVDVPFDGDTENQLELYLDQSQRNGVFVDWGDGSPIEETVFLSHNNNTGYTKTKAIHKYPKKGRYVITIDIAAGMHAKMNYLMSYNVTELIVGDRFTEVDAYSMNDVYNLKAISIPKECVFELDAFYYPVNLKIVVFSRASIEVQLDYAEGVAIEKLCLAGTTTQLGSLVIPNLERIIIPPLVTEIPKEWIDITTGFCMPVIAPSNIMTIGADAISSYYVPYFDFSQHTSIPQLSKELGRGDGKIIVPDNLYDQWKAATNWSAIASYIIKKSDWDALNA